MTDAGNRVRNTKLKILSEQHYVLRKADFEYRRRDGSWQHQSRESYDIGDGAAVLPIDRAKGLVLLVRQFRWPAFEHGYREFMVETIAGKLDGDTPEACAAKEAMEEAGVAITSLHKVFHCFMSPGAVQERLHLFVADYDSDMSRSVGAGLHDEGEDIEVLEMNLSEAFTLIASDIIVDAKTIMLIQWAMMSVAKR